MQIVCTTIEAATQVFALLMDEQVGLRYGFTLHPFLTSQPPITFTLLQQASPAFVSQLQALPNVTLVEPVSG